MITVNGYTIVNDDKWVRAVEGVVGRGGVPVGGVGKEATDEAKLAAYDKLGGLILKGKTKVKTGSFYDFKEKAQRETPDVKLVFRDIEGNTVELGETEEKPIEILAAEKIEEKKIEKAKEEYEEKAQKKTRKTRKKKDDE